MRRLLEGGVHFKIKIEENEIMYQFKIIRYFLTLIDMGYFDYLFYGRGGKKAPPVRSNNGI